LRIHPIEVTEITVPKDRQRREFDAQALLDLAGSIAQNGLIHPVVIRRDEDGQMVLVAGERRLRALEYCWEYGDEVKCGDHIFPERIVPCLYMGDLDPVDAFEVELEENIRRTDLDWKEVAIARGQLMELRQRQAERDGTPAPTIANIVEEVSDAKEIQASYVEVRQDLILARNLDNPVVARASSRREAIKALKRDEELRHNQALGVAIGATFSSSMHTLLQGDCLSVMSTLPSESFDIVLTDPPYGIGADDFGDSGGAAPSGHRYDDSYETWKALLNEVTSRIYLLAKPESHAYMFCDIDRFHELKRMMESAGWRVFRTPLIWHNPTAMRAPWPEHGPQRKYQLILYAVRGNKPVTRLYADVIQCPSDPNLGWAAQKPVALLSDLLRRSSRPGDSILDPFAGSGSIYPACHEAKCRATGIEIDPAACGIAKKRLEELK
jgi:site-specific DNA-methyltransferase (adenine-specific)